MRIPSFEMKLLLNPFLTSAVRWRVINVLRTYEERSDDLILSIECFLHRSDPFWSPGGMRSTEEFNASQVIRSV